MSVNHWINFTTRLPSPPDANNDNWIEAQETMGGVRSVLWNWIPPTQPQAAQLWIANGFIAWRKKVSAPPPATGSTT